MTCVALRSPARRVVANVPVGGFGVGLPGRAHAEVLDGNVGLVLVEAGEVAEPVVDETSVYDFVARHWSAIYSGVPVRSVLVAKEAAGSK